MATSLGWRNFDKTERSKTWPIYLAERGYDVWLGNSRGIPYSNVNIKDGEWSLKERWNHSWADMGQYDIPAFVERIIEETEKPKVTLLGNSQGGA